jgi:hypothetical protein
MRQRERRAGIHQLILEIIKGVIEEKASRLREKGYTTISSREVYRHCLEKLGNENKCVGITTYVAKLLNNYCVRLNNSYKPKWRITIALLEKLFSISESYDEIKDIPLNNLDDTHFLYIVTSLLYEAKVESGDNGNGDRR